jgi:hypothetical protein
MIQDRVQIEKKEEEIKEGKKKKKEGRTEWTKNERRGKGKRERICMALLSQEGGREGEMFLPGLLLHHLPMGLDQIGSIT